MEPKFDLMKKLGFDEILEYTFKLYRKNFFYFIKIFSYFIVPAIIVYGIFQFKVLENYKVMFNTVDTTAMKPSEARGMVLLTSMVYYLIMIGAYVIFYTLGHAALVKSAYEKITGNNVSVKRISIDTLKKTFPIIVTTIIYYFIAGAGMLLCIIPFFFLAVYMIFIVQIQMIENKHYFKAVGRSFNMVQGYFWITLLIPLVYYFVYLIIAAIINYSILLLPYVKMIKGVIKNQGQTDFNLTANFYNKYSTVFLIQVVLNNILSILLSPIFSIAVTIKFLNIRNLKEGTTLLDKIKKEKNK